MASFINAADVIAAAVEIEKRGAIFYQDVATKSTVAADKEFFTFMAEEEKRHEGIFAGMLSRLGGLSLPVASSDDEYFAYVKDLLDSHSLFMEGQKEKALESPYILALQFEKDTLLYFMAIEDLMPEAEKKYVRACAEEERQHLRMITAKMKK